MGFHDSLVSHLSFVQCEQVKFEPKRKVKKCSGGRRDSECVQWGKGGRRREGRHGLNLNFCNSFN